MEKLTNPSTTRADKELVKKLVDLGFLHIKHHVVWGDHSRLIIGKNVTLNNALLNTRSGTITLKDGCWCGHNVMILTGKHHGRKNVPEDGFDIMIGENVWLCSGVIVLGGVQIGANSVIGAGAVVTKDIPPDSFAVGIPAKVKHDEV